MPGNSGLAKDIWERSLKNTSRPGGGWKWIGSGGTRTAFLGPDNVVYKVGDPWANLNEARASRKLSGQRKFLLNDVKIPTARTFKAGGDYHVLAMDYVERRMHLTCERLTYGNRRKKCTCRTFGTPRRCIKEVIDWLTDNGIEDMFEGNIIYGKDNFYHVIDLGFQE